MRRIGKANPGSFHVFLPLSLHLEPIPKGVRPSPAWQQNNVKFRLASKGSDPFWDRLLYLHLRVSLGVTQFLTIHFLTQPFGQTRAKCVR
jgi:hypothetical protein